MGSGVESEARRAAAAGAAAEPVGAAMDSGAAVVGDNTPCGGAPSSGVPEVGVETRARLWAKELRSGDRTVVAKRPDTSAHCRRAGSVVDSVPGDVTGMDFRLRLLLAVGGRAALARLRSQVYVTS